MRPPGGARGWRPGPSPRPPPARGGGEACGQKPPPLAGGGRGRGAAATRSRIRRRPPRARNARASASAAAGAFSARQRCTDAAPSGHTSHVSVCRPQPHVAADLAERQAAAAIHHEAEFVGQAGERGVPKPRRDRVGDRPRRRIDRRIDPGERRDDQVSPAFQPRIGVGQPAPNHRRGEAHRGRRRQAAQLEIGAAGQQDRGTPLARGGLGERTRGGGRQHAGVRLDPHHQPVRHRHRLMHAGAPSARGRVHPPASSSAATALRCGRHRPCASAAANAARIASRAAGFSACRNRSTASSPSVASNSTSNDASKRSGNARANADQRIQAARDLGSTAIAVPHHPRDPGRIGRAPARHPRHFLGQRADARRIGAGRIGVPQRRPRTQAGGGGGEPGLVRGPLRPVQHVGLGVVLHVQQRIGGRDATREPGPIRPALRALGIGVRRRGQVALGIALAGAVAAGRRAVDAGGAPARPAAARAGSTPAPRRARRPCARRWRTAPSASGRRRGTGRRCAASHRPAAGRARRAAPPRSRARGRCPRPRAAGRRAAAAPAPEPRRRCAWWHCPRGRARSRRGQSPMLLDVAAQQLGAGAPASASAARVGTARGSMAQRLRPVGSTSARPRVGAPAGPGGTKRPSRRGQQRRALGRGRGVERGSPGSRPAVPRAARAAGRRRRRAARRGCADP